jgi:hypothetical protein
MEDKKATYGLEPEHRICVLRTGAAPGLAPDASLKLDPICGYKIASKGVALRVPSETNVFYSFQ